MRGRTRIRHTRLLLTLTGIVIAGCESPDRRLADFAERATQQQARQNERLAAQSEAVTRQTQEVAAAAHDLVEQDAVARRELIQAQDELQKQIYQERSDLNRQREQLDSEKKAAAAAVVRDPIIAQAIIATGLIGAALLPLLVTLYALKRLPEQNPSDDLLGNPLLEELIIGNTLGGLPRSSQPAPPGLSLPSLEGPDEGSPASG